MVAASCGSPAQSAPGATAPAASDCQPAAVDHAETEIAHGRIRAGLRTVEQARICPADKTRALILRLDLMFRLGRNDAARKLLDAEGPSIDPAHTRVFRKRLELAASASAQPVSIDEALKDLEVSHAAAALEGFNQALGQDGDDVRALIGAGQALAVLDRQRESRERFDHALDVAERLAAQSATPVLLRNLATDWNGTRVEVLPEGKEGRAFYGKARSWLPVQLMEEGFVDADGTLAVARAPGGAWALVSPRSLRAIELGSFDRVVLRPDGKYALACAAGKKVLFDRLGNRVSEVARPCGSGRVQFEGEIVAENGDKHVEVSSLPSLHTVVDVASDPPVLFSAQQLVLVAGVAPSDTARLVDLRDGKLVATVHGKALSAGRFALSTDAKRLLWQDGLEVRAMEIGTASETSMGSTRQSNDGPVGYVADGRACLVTGETSSPPPLSWARGSMFPAGKPPKGWAERCIVHADHSATAVLVPAKAKLLARASDATSVHNEVVSSDGKLAAFVENMGGKPEQLSALIVGTDPEHPSVLQRIALAGAVAGPMQLAFSADATKLGVGEQIYEVSTGAKASPSPQIEAIREQPPIAWRDAAKLEGPAADREQPDRRVVGPTEAKPGPSVTRADLFEPGGKGATSTPVVLHDSITVERDRFGVVRWSSHGKPLACLVAFDQGRRYVAFLPERKVEIVGAGAPPANLYCRVGRFLLPFDACREELIVRGEVDRILSGAAANEE